MQIASGNMIIRDWNVGDAPALASIANNKKIFDHLRDGFPHPYTLEDAKSWIKNTRENTSLMSFAIEWKGELAGSIGIVKKEDIYRKNVEIGYFLGEKFWNQGIMTTVIYNIVTYIFQHLDVMRIYAEPFASNTASRKALEKAGFRCEALLRKAVIKNGVMLDSCIYAILKEDLML